MLYTLTLTTAEMKIIRDAVSARYDRLRAESYSKVAIDDCAALAIYFDMKLGDEE